MDFKETPNLQMERSIISRKTLSDYGPLVQRLGCYPVTVEKRVRFSRELILSKTFTEIGRIYGVTDNTIRKWCKDYDLPHTKKELREIYK